MIRVSNIRLDVGDSRSAEEIASELTGGARITRASFAKKSIDARKKNDVHYVCALDIEGEDEKRLLSRLKNARRIEHKPYVFPTGTPKKKPIVVVGTGPAGLLCALTLAQNGYKVIMLERGRRVEERVKDVEGFWTDGQLHENSNVQFGEGGAGTFSDGKLTTGINDFRIDKVLREFHSHGAPEEILYNAKPHIGTDKLRAIVASIRDEIVALGGEVRFSSRLTAIKTSDNAVCAAVVNDEYEIETDNIALAIGHSARDTFVMLRDTGVNMEQKSFSVGVRIEHLQEMINKRQYGEFYDRLPAADYKLAVHLENGRGVYTFCMCPGGEVVASASEAGGVVTNGMSLYARDGENANSALLVSVTPEDFKDDDPLAGMYFQREIEKRAFKAGGESYLAPSQTVGAFLGNGSDGKYTVKPTYRLGVAEADLDTVLPKFVTDSLREAILKMDGKLHGFADAGAVITAPETRSSSPVRIIRDKETMQSNIRGLYPCGEGAGYAGGIMSAAVDGIKAAEKIAEIGK